MIIFLCSNLNDSLMPPKKPPAPLHPTPAPPQPPPHTALHPTPTPVTVVYMRRWTGLAVVQLMACRLFGNKLLPKPMLTYFQMDP